MQLSGYHHSPSRLPRMQAVVGGADPGLCKPEGSGPLSAHLQTLLCLSPWMERRAAARKKSGLARVAVAGRLVPVGHRAADPFFSPVNLSHPAGAQSRARDYERSSTNRRPWLNIGEGLFAAVMSHSRAGENDARPDWEDAKEIFLGGRITAHLLSLVTDRTGEESHLLDATRPGTLGRACVLTGPITRSSSNRSRGGRSLKRALQAPRLLSPALPVSARGPPSGGSRGLFVYTHFGFKRACSSAADLPPRPPSKQCNTGGRRLLARPRRQDLHATAPLRRKSRI